jgi:integrase
MTTQTQSGYLYEQNGSWHVRWREVVRQPDGSLKKVNRSQRLASKKEYPRKTEMLSVMNEFMAKQNGATGVDGEGVGFASMTIAQFVEGHYLPFVSEQKRPSTHRGYEQMWKAYVRDRIGSMRLRDFKTVHGRRLLKSIAAENDLTRTTFQHIKGFVSGIFTFALNEGVYAGTNPMQRVLLPPARSAGETYVYSSDEISQMMAVLPEPVRTVVAVAAYTGLRSGEIIALRWEDVMDGSLIVSRSIWRGHVSEPKTAASKAAVPVIPELSVILESYRHLMGDPRSGFIFRNDAGGAIDMEKLGSRVVRPVIQTVGIRWHGWHAFRRGLASNLYRLGVSDKVVQAILRHAKPTLTKERYIKTSTPDVEAAMNRYQEDLTRRGGTWPVRAANLMVN